jgi:hypothetical protein
VDCDAESISQALAALQRVPSEQLYPLLYHLLVGNQVIVRGVSREMVRPLLDALEVGALSSCFFFFFSWLVVAFLES